MQARMHQSALTRHRDQAAEHQRLRDATIHELRASDVERWSYAAIAEAVGIGRPLVIDILRRAVAE